MKKLSKLLLGLILSFMVIQVPLALSNAVYAVDDTTTEDVVTQSQDLSMKITSLSIIQMEK